MTKVENMGSTTTNSVTLIDLINLTHDVASLNAVYLGIAVSAVLVLASILLGVFYFFNLKPLQEKISKQEEQITKDKEKNKKEIDRMVKTVEESQKESLKTIANFRKEIEKALGSRMDEAEGRLGALEKTIKKEIDKLTASAKIEELQNLWNKHYLWGIAGVYWNELSTLIESLSRSVSYNLFVARAELQLTVISETLDKIIEKYGHANDADSQKIRDKLINVLGELEGYEDQKKEINKKVEALFSDDH